jgi:hypothetical protein
MPARFRSFQPKGIVVGGGPTPPNLVDANATAFDTTTTPKALAITPAVGDVLVVAGMGSNWSNSGSDLAISGGGLTWDLKQANVLNSYSQHHVWTAVSNTATPFSISVTNPTGSGGNPWGFSFTQWNNSAGVGNTAKTTNANGVPSTGLTTTDDSSAIVWSNTDWVPQDGSGRAYLSINGLGPTERVYFFDGGIGTFYVASYGDAGVTGAKTAGLSGPSGQKYVSIGVEVLGL